MEIKKSKLLLPISLMAVLAIILIVTYSIFQNFTNHSPEGEGLCPRMVPNYLLWLSLILMVVIIVPISYYVISKRLEEKMEKNLSAITKMVDHKVKSDVKKENLQTNNNGSILKLLNSNEKKVVEKLIENRGTILQSQISRMEGMSKLKAHRTVKELKKRGIINIESYGKTNRIELNEDFKQILVS
jgi:predicted PurR-regulated permease PerM